MTAMLEVKDLHVAYGKIEAVKGISFTVEEGQVVTLIGTNGAGKTTTLRTISGLLRRCGDRSPSRASRSAAPPPTRSSSSASRTRPRGGASSPG